MQLALQVHLQLQLQFSCAVCIHVKVKHVKAFKRPDMSSNKVCKHTSRQAQAPAQAK